MKYRGRVKSGFSGVWVSVTDDSGILKYQDEVEFVVRKDGSVMLLIDDKKAIERQRDEWNRKFNSTLH